MASATTHHKNLGHFILIAAFAIIAMMPSYFGGVPIANDQAQHYQFAWTIYDSVRAGDIYPSLAGETNHQFGDLGLRFYPALTYYSLSLVYFVVQDWYFASLIAFTLVFLFGSVGIYLWARDELGPTQALIAAFVYTLAPYHLNQIYNNFLLAEFFATAIIPFCFLYLTRVCRDGRWINVVGLTIAYAALILTHLPVTILCSMAMGLYALFLLRKTDLLTTASKLAVSVLSAVVMTSFYWSRWLPELQWIKHSTSKYFAATWDYSANFLLRPSHFTNLADDASNLWFADAMLLVTLLIALPTVIYLATKKMEMSRFLIAITAVLTVAVLMTTPLSAFVWDNVGFLQKMQFPSRWLTIVSAFMSVFAAAGIAKAAESVNAGRNVLVTIGLGVVLTVFFFAAVFVPKGAIFKTRAALNQEMTTISDSEGCECWWPIWAERSAFSQKDKVVAIGRNIDISIWSAADRRFTIGAGTASIATVATFYYPRWQATVNGAPVEVGPTESGAISLAIPAETSEVELRFREPSYVKAANIASVSAWLLVLAFGIILLLKSRRTA